MVRHDLQGDEKSRQDTARQQPAPVGEYDARYCGRDIGEGDELPDVSRRNQNEEVGRKSPHDAAQPCQPCRYAEYPQQDLEAQHQDEQSQFQWNAAIIECGQWFEGEHCSCDVTTKFKLHIT